MIKTRYEDICNAAYIGKQENPISMNDLLRLANKEELLPSTEDIDQVMFLAIDVQQDFMDKGALGVPGAIADTERMTRFIYNNMGKITTIVASIDTHNPFQIFHPCWWVDADGNNPPPFTNITLADLASGKWMAFIEPIESREYIENLEKLGKVLTIWTYHCLQGTSGCALENQFANILYYHSVARKNIVTRMVKGQDPMTEMYGIIKPEYDPKNTINITFLNKLPAFAKIVIGGEAKSHCVLESVRQILDFFHDKPEVTRKIYILEDCMSVIPGYEAATDKAFEEFKTKYKVNISKSTELTL